MQYKSNNRIIGLLNCIYYFFIVYSFLGLIVYGFEKNTNVIIYGLLLILFPIGSYLLSICISKIVLFGFLQVVLSVVTLLVIPDEIFRNITILYVVIYTFFNISDYARQKYILFRSNSLTTTIVPVTVHVIAFIKDLPVYMNFVVFYAVICTIIFFIVKQVMNFDIFIACNETTEHSPIKQIQKSNRRFLEFFLLCAALIMGITTLIPSNNLLYYIRSLLKMLMNHDYGNAPNIRPTEAVYALPPTDTPVKGKMDKEWHLINFNPFMDKLLTYGTILFCISLVILILIALYIGIKNFKKRKNEVVQAIDPDVPDSIHLKKDVKSTPLNRFFNLFGAGNNNHIRNLFYKTIRKKQESKVPNNLTSEELLDFVDKTSDLTDKQNYNKLYNKARYSNDECTKEEVAQMKKLSKKM